MKDTSEDTRDLADGVVVPEEPVLHQEVLVEGALLVLDVVEEAVETRRRLTTVGLATGRPLVVDVDEDGGARTHDVAEAVQPPGVVPPALVADPPRGALERHNPLTRLS